MGKRKSAFCLLPREEVSVELISPLVFFFWIVIIILSREVVRTFKHAETQEKGRPPTAFGRGELRVTEVWVETIHFLCSE